MFQRIDVLNTEEIVNNQENIVVEFKDLHNQILSIYKQDIVWLAIFSGTIEHWLSRAKSEYERTLSVREETEKKYAEAAKAADLAREKAGESGVAEFTSGFRKRAEDSATSANLWLMVTIFLFVATFMTTLVFLNHYWEFAEAPTHSLAETLVFLSLKIGTVGLLLASSLWTGRLYRAHLHIKEVNLHRATCLDNMRAFHASVQDQGIKDIVVLEFSRAATQGSPTGFISTKVDGRADNSTQVLSLAAKGIPTQGSN